MCRSRPIRPSPSVDGVRTETVAIVEVATVLAEPARATMCLALLDGRAGTVGELARRLGVLLRDGMIRHGLLDTTGGLSLTPSGREVFSALGVHTLPARSAQVTCPAGDFAHELREFACQVRDLAQLVYLSGQLDA